MTADRAAYYAAADRLADVVDQLPAVRQRATYRTVVQFLDLLTRLTAEAKRIRPRNERTQP
jgi:hypothetical protein